MRSEAEVRTRLERTRRLRDEMVKRANIETAKLLEAEIAVLLWVLEEI